MENVGDFFKQKLDGLNPKGVPQAIGFAWYRRESYAQCLALFSDAANFPPTFDEWLVRAKEAERQCLEKGLKVVRAEIDPREFARWCADEGYAHIDTAARSRWGNLKALESLRGSHG
jgi:hypothetical protein